MITIKRFGKLMRERLADDWDEVIAITGFEGSGKTNAEIQISKEIDPKFTLQRNMLFIPNANELAKKFRELPPRSVLAIDEAARVLHKYDWMTAVQQTIIKMYATERYQNKATIALMPRFRDFTENFRNHRILIWIHVISRGIAVAKLRDPNPYVKDPWHLDENLQETEKVLKRKKTYQITPDDLLRAERRCKNYFFDFTFPDFEPKVKEEYQKLREESRSRIDLEAEIKQDRRLDNYKDNIRKWKMTTYGLLKEKGLINNMKDMERMYRESGDNIWKQAKEFRERKGLPTLAETIKEEIMIASEDFQLPEEEQITENRYIINNNNIIPSETEPQNKPKQPRRSKKQFATQEKSNDQLPEL